MPGLLPQSITCTLEYATSALICSSARPVRNGAAARDERDLAAVGQAGADADQVLLGDADVDQALGELLAEAARLLEPTESLQTATMRSSARASSISSSAKALRQS